MEGEGEAAAVAASAYRTGQKTLALYLPLWAIIQPHPWPAHSIHPDPPHPSPGDVPAVIPGRAARCNGLGGCQAARLGVDTWLCGSPHVHADARPFDQGMGRAGGGRSSGRGRGRGRGWGGIFFWGG